MNKMHTNKLYENELSLINDSIIKMMRLVQKAINDSIKVFLESDVLLAKETILLDEAIDKEELNIDEQCLEIIARRQPLGQDLRFIVSVLKMVTDVERLGDLAVNICGRIIKLKEAGCSLSFADLSPMAGFVEIMMNDTLKALIEKDEKRALLVVKNDDRIDDLYHACMRQHIEKMGRREENAQDLFHLLAIAKSLERMGDHGTNVAELIIFMIKGEDLRHTPHGKIGK